MLRPARGLRHPASDSGEPRRLPAKTPAARNTGLIGPSGSDFMQQNATHFVHRPQPSQPPFRSQFIPDVPYTFRSSRDREAEALFNDERPSKRLRSIEKTACRKVHQLNQGAELAESCVARKPTGGTEAASQRPNDFLRLRIHQPSFCGPIPFGSQDLCFEVLPAKPAAPRSSRKSECGSVHVHDLGNTLLNSPIECIIDVASTPK